MYVPQLNKTMASSDDEKASGMVYKRYELAEEKTFANLFHPDREAIVQLVRFRSGGCKLAIMAAASAGSLHDGAGQRD
jgi:hypothetical protein